MPSMGYCRLTLPVYEALNLRGVELAQNRKAKNRLTNEVLIIANALYTVLALVKARFTEAVVQ